MSKYSGIDLHSNNCVVAVIDDDDKVCCQKRVPNELERIVALLEPHRDDLVGVVVESTFNWYWLVDGLIEHGFPVKLANTAAIAQYSGMKYSGDEHDARHLAHLLRLKLLRFGHIFPPEWRAARVSAGSGLTFGHGLGCSDGASLDEIGGVSDSVSCSYAVRILLVA